MANGSSMTDYPKNFKKRVQALEAYLTELFKVEEPYWVRVYANLDGGFRIFEISIHCTTAGASYMRSTFCVFTQALILACEDYVRAFNIKAWRPEGWDSELDEFADAREKLAYVIQSLDKKEEKVA